MIRGVDVRKPSLTAAVHLPCPTPAPAVGRVVHVDSVYRTAKLPSPLEDDGLY